MAKKALENIKYGEAMAEIDRILASLQSGEADIDTLAERVKRASELIAACRARLHKAEEEVGKVLDTEQAQ